mmetsp:Transcript_29130/g.73991  ORF Transcript_29130/g.73991 Transcript_29130/m.73991 type:complete len:292 (-) Transcript_29130:235-1110(-)
MASKVGLQQVVQIADLYHFGYEHVLVRQCFDGLILRVRVQQQQFRARAGQLSLQLLDGARDSGRKQKRLPALRQCRQDASKGLLESLRQHAVCLIKDERVQATEGRGEVWVASQKVCQAPRGGDNDVLPFSNHPALGHHVPPTNDGRHLDVDVLAQGLEVLSHLEGELTDRREHQCENAIGVRRESVQDRQAVAGRLAAAGLGVARNVPAHKDLGNAQGLDLRREVHLQFLAAVRQPVSEAQLSEGLVSPEERARLVVVCSFAFRVIIFHSSSRDTLPFIRALGRCICGRC